MSAVRLSVLDQVPVAAGGTVRDALRASIGLVRSAEDAGYHRHWFAEHHLGRGRAGASPAVLVALAAAETSTIGLGSAAAVLPHHAALTLVEHYATVAELHPGRVVLGVGRALGYGTASPAAPLDAIIDVVTGAGPTAPVVVDDAERDFAFDILNTLVGVPLLRRSERSRLHEVLRYLDGPVARISGSPVLASPGAGSPLGVAVFGGGSGSSARAAAENGLPYYINAHSIPHDVAASAEIYRDGFRASAASDRPVIGISAHAVVAPSRASAERLEGEYLSTLSGLLRRGFYDPVPPSGAGESTDAEHVDPERFRAAAALSTSGEPAEVSDRLHALAESVGAEEVLVSTVVHDATDRTRSYELLAEAW